MINPRNEKIFAPEIQTVFPLMFEQSENGLTEGVKFDACDFWRPPMNNANAANVFVGTLKLTGAFNNIYDKNDDQDIITEVKRVNESSTNVCIKRTINFPNLK